MTLESQNTPSHLSPGEIGTGKINQIEQKNKVMATERMPDHFAVERGSRLIGDIPREMDGWEGRKTQGGIQGWNVTVTNRMPFF